MAENIRRAKPIETETELLSELQVSKLPDIVKDPAAQVRLIQLAPNLSLELVGNLFKAVPELSKVFNNFIGSVENVGNSLEQTKRLRWSVLHELAKADKLPPEGILEAMRIISEIEKKESIDWTAVLERCAEVLGEILAVGVAAGLFLCAVAVALFFSDTDAA
jgi:hypothetical protein